MEPQSFLLHHQLATSPSRLDALGHEDAASLLAGTLNEEKEADRTLSDLAGDACNVEAEAA
jgi:ferritin-like metal-binding protein YciE